MGNSSAQHARNGDRTPATAVILAAGAGTRMKSSLSKVLHPLLGRPMAGFTIQAARDAGMPAVVVVHHQEDQVREGLAGPGVRFTRQEQLHGTGDAVASALPALDDDEDGVVVVLYGDCPLIRSQTLGRLLDAHAPGRLVTLTTAHVDDPSGYGRLVRDADGRPLKVVEDRECTPEQRDIHEANVGLYAFDLSWLRQALPGLEPHPHKNEIYLTDLVEEAAKADGLGILQHDDAREMMGVNDRHALSVARNVLQERVFEDLSLSGVTFENPASTVVEAQVQIGPDTTIQAGAVLRGDTRIGQGVTIGAHSVISDSRIGDGTLVKPHCVLDRATVANDCQVGPYARLRPAADIQKGAKVGNFVEIKKSTVEPGAKVPHLSYVGDARVGSGANVGAGTITCNYDGFTKHRTDIGRGAFIGSNSSLVAPVRIGDGALVGAGSTVTEDVPDQDMAIGRGRQRNIKGGARCFRDQARALARKKKRDEGDA